MIYIGVVLAILLGLLIAAVFTVNIDDIGNHQNYLMNKKEAYAAMQELQYRHFTDPDQETRNPLFQQSVR